MEGARPARANSYFADPLHGPLPAILLLLTIGTGLIDAISVLGLGRVFIANMTGNIVFIGFALAGAPGYSPGPDPDIGLDRSSSWSSLPAMSAITRSASVGLGGRSRYGRPRELMRPRYPCQPQHVSHHAQEGTCRGQVRAVVG
ncbi:hypothetical protein ASG80_06490 [Agromyces sp. Soil535]|nr:hypothetical protein ASG80_06490 [Agromyces sp. Soil535]